MKKTLLVVLLTTIAVSGCIMKKQPTTSIKPVSETRKVSDFSALYLKGKAFVTIKNSPSYQVTLTGYPKALKKVKTKKEQDALILSAEQPVKVTIAMPLLTRLYSAGSVTIKGKNIKSSQFDLTATEKSQVNLEGRLDLRNLQMSGMTKAHIKGVSSRDLNVMMQGAPNVVMTGTADLHNVRIGGQGHFKFQWANSKLLDIKAKDKAHVEIAGKVRSFHLHLFDEAKFDGRQLKADKAMVKTSGMSVAKIFTINSQSALASDGSSIYYYNPPKFKTSHMAENGAILRLHDDSLS